MPRSGLKLTNYDLLIKTIHPPTQETTALAVEECVTLAATVTAIKLLCFGGFRQPADDPPKPWRLRAEALQRPRA